jgi:pyruvate,water dikinase
VSRRLLEAFQEHKRVLSDPLSIQAIMAGMEANWWLNLLAYCST